jgi:hypothetical protein
MPSVDEPERSLVGQIRDIRHQPNGERGLSEQILPDAQSAAIARHHRHRLRQPEVHRGAEADRSLAALETRGRRRARSGYCGAWRRVLDTLGQLHGRQGLQEVSAEREDQLEEHGLVRQDRHHWRSALEARPVLPPNELDEATQQLFFSSINLKKKKLTNLRTNKTL